MEIRWLEAFVAVAEELHFGNAALRLRMAQSPLSQTIRKLERSLGAELFLRSTRSVELTAAGHALLPYAREVLAQIDIAQRAVQVPQGRVYGNLKLGFTGVLNHFSLPPLALAVQRTYPDIKLSLVGRVMTRDAVVQLESGVLDLAFVGLPVDSTRINARLLKSENYGVVVPAGHWLAGAESVKLSSLSEEMYILPPANGGSVLYESSMQACAEAGFYPKVAQEITDPYMVMMLVAAGIGIAILTESVREVLPPGTAFVPLEGTTVQMHHGLAWATRPGSAARDAVLELSETVLPSIS